MGSWGVPCSETQKSETQKSETQKSEPQKSKPQKSKALKFEPLVTVSLAKQIADQIRGSITDGRLKADDQLPTEQELAKQFEVSRPTIREALKRLAAQNLIRSRRGPAGGTFVNRPSYQELGSNLTTATALLVSMGEFEIPEVMEARHELEVVCARLAAKSRLVPELDIMAGEIETQKESTLSDVEFCASDVRFHRALADASHNPVIRFVMFSVIEALQSIGKMVVLRFRERKEIVKQHEKILAAVKAQDADAAAAAVTEQADYLRERFDVALGWKYVQRLVESNEAQDDHGQPQDEYGQSAIQIDR